MNNNIQESISDIERVILEINIRHDSEAFYGPAIPADLVDVFIETVRHNEQ